jgi:ATP-dependent helicase HrpA
VARIHGQLHAMVGETGLRENQQPGTFEQVHRALLAGLLGNIGVRTDTPGEYQGARGNRFWVFPGSALHRKGGKWLLAAELVETSKLYARVVASVQPEWIEQAAGPAPAPVHRAALGRRARGGDGLGARHAVRADPGQPPAGALRPWSTRRRRTRSSCGRRWWPATCRRTAASCAHNAALRQELEELEHMSRRVDVLVDDDAVHAHFARVVPRDIGDARAFERWRKDAEQKDPRILDLTRETLMRHTAAAVTAQLFPRSCPIDGVECRYDYRFEPGHPADGVTLTLPLHLLNRVDPRAGEWLVPGLLREELTLLVKGLPKAAARLRAGAGVRHRRARGARRGAWRAAAASGGAPGHDLPRRGVRG